MKIAKHIPVTTELDSKAEAVGPRSPGASRSSSRVTSASAGWFSARCVRRVEVVVQAEVGEDDAASQPGILENPRKSPKILENHRKSPKILANPWKSMKILENPWKSLKVLENPWKSLKVLESPWSNWRSLKVLERAWKSFLKVLENPWKPLK